MAETMVEDGGDDLTAVTRLDRAWNRAYIEGRREALGEILSDDFVAVAHDGQRVGKALLMQKPAEAALEVRFSEFEVSCWGATAATWGRIYVRTASAIIEQRFMRVYARRDGRWWAVGVQVVPIAGREPGQPPPPESAQPPR